MSITHGSSSGVVYDGDIPGPSGFIWGFIALEYYALILNRIRLVLITSDKLISINAGGPIIAPRSPTNSWYDPFFYISNCKIRRYSMLTMNSADLLRTNRFNWACNLCDINEISLEIKSKWGMGNVPYSGRLSFIVHGKKHDLILVGNQNGREIEEALKNSRSPKYGIQLTAQRARRS